MTFEKRRSDARAKRAGYKNRHQIMTTVNDDIIEWLKRRQGEGDNYKSLSAVTREVLDHACKFDQTNKEIINEHSGRRVEGPAGDDEDSNNGTGVNPKKR